MEVGQVLRQAREAANLTQREVAEHLGIRAPSWSQIESGRRGLAAHHIEPVITFLALPPDEAAILRSAARERGVTLRDIDAKLDEVLRRLDGGA